MNIQVGFLGRDFISFESSNDQYPLKNLKLISLSGCYQFLKSIQELKLKFGVDISKWPLPVENDHVSVLVRELVLKVLGQWEFPYSHEELCHCRQIMTKDVDQSIVWGAHNSNIVSIMTTASTACGTCRPDVEKIIKFRLK